MMPNGEPLEGARSPEPSLFLQEYYNNIAVNANPPLSETLEFRKESEIIHATRVGLGILEAWTTSYDPKDLGHFVSPSDPNRQPDFWDKPLILKTGTFYDESAHMASVLRRIASLIYMQYGSDPLAEGSIYTTILSLPHLTSDTKKAMQAEIPQWDSEKRKALLDESKPIILKSIYEDAERMLTPDLIEKISGRESQVMELDTDSNSPNNRQLNHIRFPIILHDVGHDINALNGTVIYYKQKPDPQKMQMIEKIFGDLSRSLRKSKEMMKNPFPHEDTSGYELRRYVNKYLTPTIGDREIDIDAESLGDVTIDGSELWFWETFDNLRRNSDDSNRERDRDFPQRASETHKMLITAQRSEDGSSIFLRIDDWGRGFPAERLKKGFVRGETDKSYGSGVAMSVCEEALQRYRIRMNRYNIVRDENGALVKTIRPEDVIEGKEQETEVGNISGGGARIELVIPIKTPNPSSAAA